MNHWLVAATVLLAAFAPCAIVALRASNAERLMALQVASTLTATAFIVLGAGYGRSVYFILALVTAMLSSGGTLAFARFLERWV